MPRKVVAVTSSSPTGEKICSFCGLKDDNELEFGKFHEYDGIVTHYYCLLLSSNMQQRGNDNEGILGFLPEDINKELKRGRRLACCYCKKTGATLGCCNTKCKRIFHFPCGLKSGSLHQFFGEFKSYCKTHRPAQKIDERVSQEVKTRDSMICYICYDEVDPRDMLGTLWAPCCKKNAWFHRMCVQQLAMSAGYFFKCPLCNNKTEFQKAMLDHGIFIPSQDASWELVPNAFEELLYRHNRCDAHKCLCPKGREHASANAKWELTLCRTCGSQGIHIACGRLKWVKPMWECSECTSILHKSVTAGNGDSRDDSSALGDGDQSTEDESSDSDISVGGVSDTRAPINQQPVKSARTDDELPPVPKKPRISVIRTAEPLATDSDDDIIVLSGPSRKETEIVATSEEDRSEEFERNSAESRVVEVENKVELGSSMGVRELDASTIETLEADPKLQLETSMPAETRVVKRPSSGSQRPSSGSQRPPPVEIDLSEGEITVPESIPTYEPKRTESAFVDTPELNIKISNVTSLAPGAFDLVPESRNRQINVSLMNGGLSPLDPIVIDDRSTPKESQNNNTLYNSGGDHLRIVRFDGAPDCPRSDGNSVVYGLTIPGTNHTVPLIVTPPQNCKSKTPGLHADPNNPLGVALCDCNGSRSSSVADILNLSVFSGPISGSTTSASRKDNSSSASSTVSSKKSSTNSSTKSSTNSSTKSSTKSSTNSSTKPTVEKPMAPQSIDPKMWSVPLKSIVQGTIPRSMAESSLRIASNSMFVGNFSSLDGLNGSSVTSKQAITIQAANIVQNGVGSSSSTPSSRSSAMTPQLYAQVAPADVPAPNGLVPQLFTVLPVSQTNVPTPKLFQASQANTTLPNGVVSPASSRNSKVPTKTTSPSPVWVKINGSYIPVDPDTAKDFVTAKSPPPAPPQVKKKLAKPRLHPKPATSNGNSPISRHVPPDKNDREDSSSNCDGDAGSDPAVQPASVSPTNARLGGPRKSPASPSGLGAVLDDWKRSDTDRTIAGRCDNQEDDTAECPATFDGCYSSNRTGLINKTINLRDIKFTIGGPNIVKMTLYETYNVNIRVDTTSRCKYHESNDLPDAEIADREGTHKPSIIPGDEVSSIANCDSEDTVDSLKNERSSCAVGNLDDAAQNESDITSENNDSTTKSVTTPAQIDVSSRGQDELKENRDPVPASNNSTDATIVVDRKSKTRSRAGISDHSMRSLNEKERRETIVDKIGSTPSKIVANETQLVANPSKISHNGCKEKNDNRALAASNEADVNSSSVTRSFVNDSANEDNSENFETAKKRRISVKDGNSNDTRDSGKSATADDSKNCNYIVAKPLVEKASIAQIAEQFESAKKRRISVKDETSSRTRDSDKSTTANESKKYNHAKPVISDASGVEIKEHFEAAKRRRISTNENETRNSIKSANTNDSRSCICTKINSLVNTVARSKRKLSETKHICRFDKLRRDDTLRNGEIGSSEESLCCKVSIDLTRIREVLQTKLNAAEDVKFHERNGGRSFKKFNSINRHDSKKYFEHKQLLSRSRSFDNLISLDRPRADRSSSVELQRSQSLDNLNCFSIKNRRANGAIEDNRRRSCKRKTRSFEKHDCVR